MPINTNFSSRPSLVIVYGGVGVGKTAFSVSASRHAPDKMPAESGVQCDDVVMFTGDLGGVAGAVDVGLTPRGEYDFTGCATWDDYKKQFAAAVLDVQPLIQGDAVSTVVVDLSLPASLIVSHVAPDNIAKWGEVGRVGASFRAMFLGLRPALVVLNAHAKSAVLPVETEATRALQDSRAAGGERAVFTIDAAGSVVKPFLRDADLYAREAKRAKANAADKNSPTVIKRYTHTAASQRFEAKTRAANRLPPTLPGEMTLRALLDMGYGMKK